jgi:hypothetical protein
MGLECFRCGAFVVAAGFVVVKRGELTVAWCGGGRDWRGVWLVCGCFFGGGGAVGTGVIFGCFEGGVCQVFLSR